MVDALKPVLLLCPLKLPLAKRCLKWLWHTDCSSLTLRQLLACWLWHPPSGLCPAPALSSVPSGPSRVQRWVWAAPRVSGTGGDSAPDGVSLGVSPPAPPKPETQDRRQGETRNPRSVAGRNPKPKVRGGAKPEIQGPCRGETRNPAPNFSSPTLLHPLPPFFLAAALIPQI